MRSAAVPLLEEKADRRVSIGFEICERSAELAEEQLATKNPKSAPLRVALDPCRSLLKATIYLPASSN